MIPVQAGGRRAVLLRDPRRLSQAEMVVPADIAFLLSKFDGQHTVREAQVAYVRRFGTLLTMEKLGQLLRQLEDAHFLDTEGFKRFEGELAEEFRSRPTRAAAHAGRSYPEGAGEFTRLWQERLAGAAPPSDFSLDLHRPALIVPHYDLNGAADCYAAAYAALAEAPQPEVVVILGIAHSGGEAPFILTRKPFETPFGALEADDKVIGRLESGASGDLYAEELLHRDEHSIEFQAVLLHFLYRESSSPRAHPLRGLPSERGRGGRSRLRRRLPRFPADGPGGRFAPHCGHRLGRSQPRGGAVRRRSRQPGGSGSLAAARHGSPGARAGGRCRRVSCRPLAQAEDRYHVCGFPAIHALLRILDISEGRLLKYRQAVEPQTQSCVSFASVALR